MKKEFIIDVTEEDIDQGERRNCHKCPVARAISRAFGGGIEVSESGIYYGRGGDSLVATPNKVANFIRAFDGGWPVAPFSFPLALDLLEPEVSHA